MPPTRLDAKLDHVAIAVPTWEDGERRWKHQLGGGVVAFGRTPAFWSRQLRFANGGKLELLAPPPEDDGQSFVRRFLDRFGAQIHHVTLKVPNLPEALETLTAAGHEPVDVQMDNAYWQEAFLRPSVVGGLVVQIAWAAQSDDEWARNVGHVPESPAADAVSLRGPLLEHPDLRLARELWSLLGADIHESDGLLVCSWPSSPLEVRIAAGPAPRAVALLIGGGRDWPAHAAEGPETRASAG